MSGSEIAAEEGLAHFNVTIVFGPLFVDRVKDVDIDLLIGTKLTFLADKGCNRRRQIAHLDDRLVGGGDMGEAVVIVAEPLQAFEREIQNAGQFKLQGWLQVEVLSAEPLSRRQQ